MNGKIRLLAILIVSCFSLTNGILYAQVNTQLPYIPEIAQSVIYRPSILPKNYWYISIPFLSNENVGFVNDGLNYMDAHSKTSNGSYIDLPVLLNSLNSHNTLAIDYSLDIFSFGFRRQKNYFSFNLSQKIPILFRYTDELFNLIYKGNGAFLGKSIDLSKCGFDASNYWEIGIGMTRQLNDKWSAGFRINRLYGLDNISTSLNTLVANTDPNDYTLRLQSDMVINTSTPFTSSGGFDSVFNSGKSTLTYLLNAQNGGWGFNFGVSYKLNKVWLFSFDAIDVGKINWKDSPKNYHFEDGNYTFSGIYIDKLPENITDSIEYIDSLKNSFNPIKTYNAYSTALSSKVSFSTQYQIAHGTYTTLVMRGLFFQNEFIPSFALMIRHNIGKHFTICMNYSRQYGTYNSLGMGFDLQIGKFNIFVLSDNLIGTLKPFSNKSLHANFGINLCWINPKKIPPKKNIEDIERY